MTQKTTSEQNALELRLFDQFIALTGHRDLEELLAEALVRMISSFEALGGSLLFIGNPSWHLRQGQLDEEVMEQIKLWEKSVEERATKTQWSVMTPRYFPVSTRIMPCSGFKLLNTLLLTENKVIGSLSLVLHPERSLSDPQTQLLAYFTRAFGNVTQLLSELRLTQHRLGYLGMIYQMGQAMSSTFELRKLLEGAMQVASRVTHAEAASLMLVDEERRELIFKFAHTAQEDVLRKQRISMDTGIAGWVATHSQPVIVNEVRRDPRFNPQVDAHTGFVTRSIACVPLQTKGRTIGVLEALNKNSAEGFNEDDIQMMLTLAAQAAIAIENAKLYQSLREERDKILEAQETVRRELARRLHDGTIQLLAAIDMNIEYVERLLQFNPEGVAAELQELHRMTRQATSQARQVLFELRPVILESQGLVSTLEAYVEQMKVNEPFAVHLQAEVEDQDVRSRAGSTIFSIMQEAISNIKKHAKAQNVWITLKAENEDLVVSIRDDGHGFDLEAVQQDYASRGSLGLLNMRERAELLEGTLTITSGEETFGGGTIVTLRVPLNDNA
jgi:signal transduction histidine kinase